MAEQKTHVVVTLGVAQQRFEQGFCRLIQVLLQFRRAQGGEDSGEPADPKVDEMGAALDQPVGIEGEGRAG